MTHFRSPQPAGTLWEDFVLRVLGPMPPVPQGPKPTVAAPGRKPIAQTAGVW